MNQKHFGLAAGATILLALFGTACPSCNPFAECSSRESCSADTNCTAGNICIVGCCVAGCRDDGDCAGSNERCAPPAAGEDYGTCVGVCQPIADLDQKVFHESYTCTRAYDNGTAGFCADNGETGDVRFVKTTTAADGTVSYRIEDVPANASATSTATFCNDQMSFTLTAAASAQDPGYTENGTWVFSDGDNFSGTSTYTLDWPTGDPSAGGGQCTQTGRASAAPPAPAAIPPLCQ